jgi:hypothetical protein
MALAKERNARVRHRAAAPAVLSNPVLAFVVALVWFIHGLLWWVCIEALVLLFGAVGRPQGKPLVSRATTPLLLAPILRADVVEVALRAISGLMKRDAVIELPDPIVKDGPGWLARINLPHGDTGRRDGQAPRAGIGRPEPLPRMPTDRFLPRRRSGQAQAAARAPRGGAARPGRRGSPGSCSAASGTARPACVQGSSVWQLTSSQRDAPLSANGQPLIGAAACLHRPRFSAVSRLPDLSPWP